eukprot:Trichotokara_eunicae@DN5077_c0_g1_i1.p1
MDGRTFVKVFKDSTDLMSGKDAISKRNDLDIIFASVAKGGKRISASQFSEAVKLVSEKYGLDADVLVKKVTSSEGPVYEGAKAAAVKWHDDKSTYTGTQKSGGPQAVLKGAGSGQNVTSIRHGGEKNVKLDEQLRRGG